MGLDSSGDLLLASCAQDAYIRLWRIAREKTDTANVNLTIVREGDGEKEEEGELKLTGNSFTVVDDENISHQYTVTLESVLLGKTETELNARQIGIPTIRDTHDHAKPCSA